jgi:tRNA (guanine-N7-)-methyltransferase
MGKNKLARFAENKILPNVIQPTREDALNGFDLKGKWRTDFFKNDNPIVLELGCGKENILWGLQKHFLRKILSELILKGQDSGLEPKKL